jgi:predicted N-acetyltransferase YhbS
MNGGATDRRFKPSKGFVLMSATSTSGDGNRPAWPQTIAADPTIERSLRDGGAGARFDDAPTLLRRELASDEPLRVVAANAGDYPSIHRFLLNVFHRPSAGEFHAQRDEPTYEPTDRLLIKRGPQIIGHVFLTRRQMHFGPWLLPVAGLADLGTLPEFRGQGLAAVLLAEAERQMLADGAMLGMLRTSVPQFFMSRGWVVCGRHCYSTASARDILSYLSAAESSRGPMSFPAAANVGVERLNIRLWRHVEQAALTRLYRVNTQSSFGWLTRSDDYWRWLISRRGYDRIYVAIEGPDKLDLDDAMVRIVGYAVMKESRIVELMTSPEHPDAAAQILARACGDAIERDQHTVRLDAPPGHPLHRLIEAAGGRYRCHEAEQGEVFMVKLFDPLGFLQQLGPQLHQRAKAAGLARPCELGLLVGDEKYSVSLTRRGVKLIAGKLGRSYLACTMASLSQLLLGHLDVHAATATGRLTASTRVAVETASALFPRLPMWRPPWDDLQA